MEHPPPPTFSSRNPGLDFDVAVLGAGAAGMVAAFRAAECGARVIVLEKNRRPGVKILMSGGTRCNLTNARGLRRLDVISGPVDPGFDPVLCRGSRAIQDGFGAGGAFLGPALRKFDVDQTIRLFESEGLATKVEANGKIFPVSDKATDVLQALVDRLGRSGATLGCKSPVQGLEPLPLKEGGNAGFRVGLPGSAITAGRVIMTLGGMSYPGCGTVGDGFNLARRLGHSIVETRPALVPIRIVQEWVTTLKGLSLPDIVASVFDPVLGRVLQDRREAILFAHFGLSGPAILDISRAVTRQDEGGSLELRIDFHPDISREELDRRIQAGCRRGNHTVASLLSSSLPNRLAECVMEASGLPTRRMGPELSRAERQCLIGNLKGIPLSIAGTLGFEKAEVTSGGVKLAEVEPRTLESRIVSGLFFAGEVLDLDGLIGGYNFQGAWSTGWLAGEMAARNG